MDYQITLRRAKQRENLICGETNYTLPIGEIILQIQEFPQQHLVYTIDQIAGILEEGDCSFEQLANVYHEIVDSLSTAAWARDLFYYLPGYSAIQAANVQFERTAFSLDENEKFRIRFSTPVKNSSELLRNDKLFTLRNDENHQIGGPGLSWQYWRQFLFGKFDLDNRYLLGGMEAAMMSAGKKQLAELRRMLLEILKLQAALETCLAEVETPDDQIDKILKNAGLSVGLQDIHAAEITGVNVRSSAYHCYSLSGLVVLEYSFMRSSQSRIKICKLCRRPFASCSSRHCFCTRPNPNFGGMTCKEAGPNFLHRKVTDNDGILKTYEKAYRSYHRWQQVAKNKLSKDSFFTYEGATCEEIVSEINEIFEKWCLAAKSARKKYLDGTLSTEEALQVFALPSIPKRSSLYKDWCNDERKKRGLL